MVALVWWVALFESAGVVTRNAIRPAAAADQHLPGYHDRENLNVSKRACAARAGPDASSAEY